MKRTLAEVLAIFCILALLLVPAVAQDSKVSWYSFDMGYGRLESSSLVVHSVAGQAFVGSSAYNNTQVISGFLADTLIRGALVSVEEAEELPKIYSLDQNYPNPFNPSTKIRFSIPKESHVTLKVYDIMGQEIGTLVSDVVRPGDHEVVYDGSGLSSGVYFYRLVADGYTSTKKLVLLK